MSATDGWSKGAKDALRELLREESPAGRRREQVRQDVAIAQTQARENREARKANKR